MGSGGCGGQTMQLTMADAPFVLHLGTPLLSAISILIIISLSLLRSSNLFAKPQILVFIAIRKSQPVQWESYSLSDSQNLSLELCYLRCSNTPGDPFIPNSTQSGATSVFNITHYIVLLAPQSSAHSRGAFRGLSVQSQPSSLITFL